MNFRHCLVGIGLLLAGLVHEARADVRLPKLFSDHMVLQRDLPDAVWGWADPGEKITVTIAGQTATTITGPDGKWQVRLAPLKAGGPYELVIAGKNTITFKDVLVGDVWICAGQSNMEFALVSADNGPEAARTATNSLIRLLDARGASASDPLDDIPNGWVVNSPQTAGNAPAIGYFFGKRLQEESGVPIGLIHNSWGGTPIEAWINPNGLRAVPELSEMLTKFESQLTAYQTGLVKYIDVAAHWAEQARQAHAGGAVIPPLPPAPVQPVQGWNLSAIYNGRVAPLTSFAIKGAIWYQGETNGGEGESYYHKMRALIGGWRLAWNEGEFPFYFVQLANFEKPTNNPAGGDGWANLRMAQFHALQIPHTGMALAIDVGDGGNIHPTNKEDVGNRLALWALKNDYGQKDLVCSGPLFKSMAIDGDKIRISFNSVGRGLIVGEKKGHGPAKEVFDGKLERFAIAGADKHWVWAEAVIDGATVVVSSPAIVNPVAVRYAFAMNPVGANLYNLDGLPASPFRTDDW